MQFVLLYQLWKLFETNNDKETIINELDSFVNNCDQGIGLYIAYKERYEKMINFQIENHFESTPLLNNLFRKMSRISNEGWKFLTSGYDVYDLKKCLVFEETNEKIMFEKLNDIAELSIYIRYSFIKLLNTTDETKKESLLRGLFGL